MKAAASVFLIGVLIWIFIVFRYQKIDVFTVKGFDKETNTPIMRITDRGSLYKISCAFLTAYELEGKVDVAQPRYIFDIYSLFENKKTIYLWVDQSSIKGMYEKKSDTNKAYSFSEKNTERLKIIIKNIEKNR